MVLHLLFLLFFICPSEVFIAAAAATSAPFNIISYGAIGDNKTLNTLSIQSAIDAAAEVGTFDFPSIVLVPSGGVFLTATLSLRSNVWLQVEGALQGSSVLDDYTAISTIWDHWDVLHTVNASNTGIFGSGALHGPMWQMIASYNPAENQIEPIVWEGAFGCIGECRPRLVYFEDCANVSVSGVSLLDSADWTQLYRRVRNVTLDSITVWGSQQWPNNDGVDFESCEGVRVRNSSFFTGDDSIVLASGNCNEMSSPWPEPVGNYTPTRDVIIENCVISSHSSGIKYEAIDQTYHGDVFNVLVRNVTIYDSARGIGFQQRTGAGSAYNWSFQGVAVLRTRGIVGDDWWGDGEALWMTSMPECANASPQL